MTEPIKRHPVPRLLVFGAALVVILWGVSYAQTVLVPLLVAVFLAVLATPTMLWFRRKGMPVILAVLIVMAVMVLVILVMSAIVGVTITGFYKSMPEYQQRLHGQVTAFKDFLASRSFVSLGNALLKFVDPGAVMSLTATLFLRVGIVFSNLVLILLTTTFILLEADSFPRKLRVVLGDPKQVFPEFTRFVDEMKRYMVIKTLIGLAVGFLVTILLSILHVDFPILWGFLAFLLNYVPNLGPMIAGVPAVLLAFVQYGIGRALIAAAGYIVINFVMAYGIEMRLMGRKLGLSTLVIFLSLIFWGSLLGPVGAVLCIPLSMTLKFALENNESTRWIATLMGPEGSFGTNHKASNAHE